MPYRPKPSDWCSPAEAIAHVRAADRCTESGATGQLQAAIEDGALLARFIRHPECFAAAGPSAAPMATPAERASNTEKWREGRFDWDAGTWQRSGLAIIPGGLEFGYDDRTIEWDKQKIEILRSSLDEIWPVTSDSSDNIPQTLKLYSEKALIDWFKHRVKMWPEDCPVPSADKCYDAAKLVFKGLPTNKGFRMIRHQPGVVPQRWSKQGKRSPPKP